MAGNTFRRREKKMIIDASLVPKITERLLQYMTPDKYNENGNPSEICNLYFDNEQDDVIRNSIQKPKFKEKFRIRSYGTPNDDSPVFLELKRKLDGVGTKRRLTLTMAQARQYLETGNHPEGLSPLSEQILKEIDYYRSIHPVVPRTYVSYRRFGYFGKDDPDLRVTIDFDILTRRTDLDLEKGRYGTPLLPPELVLLETKFQGAVPLWLVRIFDEFHLSFGTFSKVGASFKHTKLEELHEAGLLTDETYQIILEDITRYGKLL